MTWRAISNYDPDVFKAKRNDEGEPICINCGKNLSSDKRRTKYCSDKCRSEYFKLHYKDWNQVKLEVFQRDNWRCKTCNADVKSAFFTSWDSKKNIINYSLVKTANCDHIVPLWKGGKDWVDDPEHTNLQTLCEDCHKKKTKQESKERTKLGILIMRGIQQTIILQSE